jgi:ABC-type multidrug transport system ATPase subunit
MGHFRQGPLMRRIEVGRPFPTVRRPLAAGRGRSSEIFRNHARTTYPSWFMLEAIELSKSYNGSVALNALNLKIQPGEIFCLLGANGAGKTTTINLFLNFIPPSSGIAKINELNVVEHPLETKKYLAYIPEQVMLYRNLTHVENLEYSPRFPGSAIRVRNS